MTQTAQVNPSDPCRSFSVRCSGFWRHISAPREVNALRKNISRDKVTTISELLAAVARSLKADFVCPITTGSFSWIAAHAAAEDAAEGCKRVTPDWRTLKSGGDLNPQYLGGIPAIAKWLRGEGHKALRRGKRFFVAEVPEWRFWGGDSPPSKL